MASTPIYGGNNAEILDGTNHSESIFGSGGDDMLNGMGGADTIVGGLDDDTLTGGKGKDTFVYYLGDGDDVITDYAENDKIKVGSSVTPRITTNGNNVIFTFGRGSNTGTVTIKNGKFKTITWLDVNGNEHLYPDPLTVSDDGKAVTLNASYSGDLFNVTAVDTLGWNSSEIETVNASAVGQNLEITANSRANVIIGTTQKDTIYGGSGADTIYGGKGNDVLYGGDGADVFAYSKGDGNDKILDYEDEDTIQISGDYVKNTDEKGNDVVLKLASGKSITVVGGVGKTISYSDSANPEGTYYPEPDPDPVVYSTDGKSATLKSSYDDDSFYVPGLDGNYARKLLNIDASAVEQSLVITANSKSNNIIGTAQKDTIYGGAGKDTIYGGKGNDILSGGDGADVFAYSKGDGNDKILDYEDEDTIQISGDYVKSISEKGSNVVLKLASNKFITVVGGVDKVINYSDTLGEHNYPDDDPDEVIYGTGGKSATLKSSYSDVTFNVPCLGGNYATKLVSIDASAVEQGLTITANGKANKIIGTSQDDAIYGGNGADYIVGGVGKDSLWGGNGDDTLFGGDDNDVFYYNGDGDDVIGDYVWGKDKIVYQGGVMGSVDNVSASGNNVVFTMSNGNTITLQNAAGKGAQIVNSSGTVLKTYYGQ